MQGSGNVFMRTQQEAVFSKIYNCVKTRPTCNPHCVSFWGNVDADIHLLKYALSDLNGSAGRGCEGKFQI